MSEVVTFLVCCDACGMQLEPGAAMQHVCPRKFTPRVTAADIAEGPMVVTGSPRAGVPMPTGLTRAQLTARLVAGEVLATIVDELANQNHLAQDHEARRWVQRWRRAE